MCAGRAPPLTPPPFPWSPDEDPGPLAAGRAALRAGALPANPFDLVFDPTYASRLKACGISILDSAADEHLATKVHFHEVRRNDTRRLMTRLFTGFKSGL